MFRILPRAYQLALAAPKPLKFSSSQRHKKILQCPLTATRMHRLFKPAVGHLMRGRRVESPRFPWNGNWGDTKHADHSGCDLALSSTWGVADLAL